MATIYSIKYTDQVNADPIYKQPFTISPGAMDTTTSLVLPGQAAALYGEHIAENFVHLLENFASATPPVNATVGQLWYDSTLKQVRVLTAIVPQVGGAKTYTWTPVGGPFTSVQPPATPGALWYDVSDVNPANWQLKIYNNGLSSWVSIADRYLKKDGDTLTGNIAVGDSSVGLTKLGSDLAGFYPAAVTGTTVAAEDGATIVINTSGDGSGVFTVSSALSLNSALLDVNTLFQVAADGRVTIKHGTLDLNGNKIANVAAGTSANDAVNFSQLSTIGSDLSQAIADLTNNKVSRVGDTMSGALTISTEGIGQGNGNSSGQGMYSLVVNGTGSNSGGILINAKDDNGDQNAIEMINNFGTGGSTQTVFSVKAFNGNTLIAGAATIGKSLVVGSTLSVTSTADFASAVTMNIPINAILNARHLTTKEYVDTKISALISPDTYARVNPTAPRNGDILINGTTTSIYNNGWKQVDPAQWAV